MSKLTKHFKKVLVVAITITIVFFGLSAEAAWFNGDWSSREKITIKASKLNGDLSEFPIYLNLADMPNSFFATVNGTGADIRITQADEISETAFELVEIDTANGQGELWFKAPTISSLTDTDFYIYYGNTSAVAYLDTDPFGTHDVWSNGFVAVYHMNEDPTGTIIDSTSFGNNGTSAGAMTSGDLVQGKLGKAIEFDGVDDEIVSDFSTSISNNITVSSIIKKDSTSAVEVIVSEYGNTEGWLLLHTNTGALGFDGRDGVSYKSSGKNLEIDDNKWHYTLGQKENSEWRVFSDSVLSSNADVSFTGDIDATQQIFIGAHSNNAGNKFVGTIDEVRISQKIRHPNWIKVKHQNTYSPGNFYLISNGQGAGFDQNLWSNYHRITIPAYTLDEDLENFPVYLDLADLPTSFFSVVQVNGADIRITTADQDTQQAVELVDIDTVNGTGELWFKAETLSSTTDNEFYIWFGNSQAQAYSRTDEFGSENVWTEGYVGVWHMSEDPSGSITDSSMSNIISFNVGGMNSSDLVAGQLNKSISFDGTQYLKLGNNANITSNTTMSGWFKSTGGPAATANAAIVAKAESGIGNMLYFGGTDSVEFYTAETAGWHPLDFIETSDNLYPLSTWNYLAGTWDGTDRKVYLDGNESDSEAGYDAGTTITPLLIGAYANGAGAEFEGELDEIRIVNTARTPSWIRAEYLNQKSTDKFYYIDNGNQIDDSQWSNNYKITIPASEINGDLTDFPVYLSLADMPNDFFTTVNGTGADIRITENDLQTQRAFELVELDTVNGTGELWFKADLSSSIDNIFYLHAGNTAAPAYAEDHLFGSQNVWSNNYAAVYHMNEDPTGLVKDSTKYSNDGNPNGAMTSNDLVKGQVGAALDFDGINDFIEVSDSSQLRLSNNWSINVWTQVKTLKNYGNILWKSNNATDGFGLITFLTGQWDWQEHDGSWSNTVGGNPTELVNSQWDNLKIQFNGSMLSTYSNSAQESNASKNNITSGTESLHIGTDINNSRYYEGIIDELQIAERARSEAWIKVEYKNQKSPGNFYLVENGNVAGFDPNLWSNKHKITIPASVVNGDLKNFPVYVDLGDLPLTFFGTVQANGDDLRVTKADQKTQLAFELVDINTITKTGELWFKADSLSSTIDNIFYIWFGNPNAQAYSRIDEFGTENVWTEGYLGVYHMNEDPTGTIIDSTKNRFHGFSNGAMLASDTTNGALGNAIEFDGVDDIIDLSTSFSQLSNNITVSTWSNSQVASVLAFTYYDGDGGGDGSGFILSNGACGPGSEIGILVGGLACDAVNSNTLFTQNQWEKYTFRKETNDFDLFLDGELKHSATRPQNITSENATVGNNFQGPIDEVVISNLVRTNSWIKTEYLNQKDTGAFYTVDNGDLNNTAWSNLFKITILASQVNGDLTDFPVYVNLNDLPSDFFSVVNGSGADIRMTLDDQKTQTSFELVELDTANGQGELWFKAPFLSGTIDTDFYLFAGNPNVEAYAEDHIFGAQNVWSNGFVAVYHMNEDPTGTIFDSTKYNNDGTANGAMTSGDLVLGQLGKSIDLDGIDDYITLSNENNFDFIGDFTISTWLKPTTDWTTAWKGIFSKYGSSTGYQFFWHIANYSYLFVNNSVVVDTNTFFSTLTSSNWHHMSSIFKSATTSNEIIIDETSYTNNQNSRVNNSNSLVPTIGAQADTGAFPANASFDEVHISDKARTNQWLNTEYNNQNSPSTFYTTEKVNRVNAVMFGRMF